MNPRSICLVTGASSGIGHALSVQLLGNNYSVIGTSRNVENLAALSNSHPDHFYALELDVDDERSTSTILERLPASWRKIDILVNNAGSDVGGRLPFDQGNKEDWVNTINTNVNGVIRVTHAVIQGMVDRNTGDIVTIGSTSGLEPVPTTAAYSASKHAVNGFSESLRKEHTETGIRVMQVLPGMVRTRFAANRFRSEKLGEEFYDDFGKWLYPEDVASSVLFLLQQPRHVEISQLVVVPKQIRD
jgi:NADP-dependent 3-hydroxy acid dehydrogenase YdfG